MNKIPFIKFEIKILTFVMMFCTQMLIAQSYDHTAYCDATLPKDKTQAFLTPAPSALPRINGADTYKATLDLQGSLSFFNHTKGKIAANEI